MATLQQQKIRIRLQAFDRRLFVRWERILACFHTFLSLATIHMWINKNILVAYTHNPHVHQMNLNPSGSCPFSLQIYLLLIVLLG